MQPLPIVSLSGTEIMNFIGDDLSKYLVDHTTQPSAILNEIAAYTVTNCDLPQMLTGPVEGQFLKTLVQLTNAKKILEIGLFTGYSAMAMAEGLPEDGQLDSCELEQKNIDIANKFFAKSPDSKKITIHQGPALKTLTEKLDGHTYDLIFLDADKENYPAYFDQAYQKLRTGGLLVVDNVLWSGAVLAPKTESDKSIVEFNKLLQDDNRFQNVMLSIRDGVSLAIKK